jgi:hypothetical protein
MRERANRRWNERTNRNLEREMLNWQKEREEFWIWFYSSRPKPTESAPGHTAGEAANFGQAFGAFADAAFAILKLPKGKDRKQLDEITEASLRLDSARAAVDEMGDALRAPHSEDAPGEHTVGLPPLSVYRVYGITTFTRDVNTIVGAVSTDREMLEDEARALRDDGEHVRVREIPQLTKRLQARIASRKWRADLQESGFPFWRRLAGAYRVQDERLLVSGTRRSERFAEALEAFRRQRRWLTIEGRPPSGTSLAEALGVTADGYSARVLDVKTRPFRMLVVFSDDDGLLVALSTFEELAGGDGLVETSLIGEGTAARADTDAAAGAARATKIRAVWPWMGTNRLTASTADVCR